MGWLRCFRGIETLTAMMMLAELHDFRRFQAPRALMAYLGLVPGEHSSGEKQLTKTGNSRLLVETAWHYRHRARVGDTLARRRRGQPGRVIAIADKAQQRSALPYPHRPADARPEGHGGDRARTGRLRVGGAAGTTDEESTPGALGPGREDDSSVRTGVYATDECALLDHVWRRWNPPWRSRQRGSGSHSRRE